MNAKEVFESVLTVPVVKKLWTVSYNPAIPFSIQAFDIGSLLPAILFYGRTNRISLRYYADLAMITNNGAITHYCVVRHCEVPELMKVQ